MNLSQGGADAFVPDGQPLEAALSRTTLMGVGAHSDDLELMAYHPILKAFTTENEWFTGVTVTNGAGPARAGRYKDYTDAQMVEVRRREQRKAAEIGEYSAMLQLNHPSANVKDPGARVVVDDLERILRGARPKEIYTHNLADKHDTHVGVMLKLVEAIRRLPAAERPSRLIGCEVWRDLDWMNDKDKVVMVVDGHDNLADALMGVFDSQICGGKRYDLAARGRRRANATFFESHATDASENVIFGMDLTPLIAEPPTEPQALYERYLGGFKDEVSARLGRLSKRLP
jgi:LmbE family N-acetylglucosaminyl deacetylase